MELVVYWKDDEYCVVLDAGNTVVDTGIAVGASKISREDAYLNAEKTLEGVLHQVRANRLLGK